MPSWSPGVLAQSRKALIRCRTRRSVSGLVSQLGHRICKTSGVSIRSTRVSPMTRKAYVSSMLSHRLTGLALREPACGHRQAAQRPRGMSGPGACSFRLSAREATPLRGRTVARGKLPNGYQRGSVEAAQPHIAPEPGDHDAQHPALIRRLFAQPRIHL